MSKEKNMNEVEVEVENELNEIDNTDSEVAEEETTKSKFKAGLKKYGKRIATGAAIVTAAVVGFVLGRRDDGVNYENCGMPLELMNDPNDDVVHYDTKDEEDTDE